MAEYYTLCQSSRIAKYFNPSISLQAIYVGANGERNLSQHIFNSQHCVRGAGSAIIACMKSVPTISHRIVGYKKSVLRMFDMVDTACLQLN